MEKKKYHIEICGESYGDTVKELTEKEAMLIRDILSDCDSEYISGKITELPDFESIIEEYKVYDMEIFDRQKLISKGITDEYVLIQLYSMWLKKKY